MILRKILTILVVLVLATVVVTGATGTILVMRGLACGGHGYKAEYDPLHYNVPQWSSDGSQIVFYYGGQLYSVDSDGSHLQLASLARPDGISYVTDISPDISPTADRVAYATRQKEQDDSFFSCNGSNIGDWDIITANLDGSDQNRLTKNRGFDIHPSWSPDGTRIAFISDFDLYTINPDGSDLTDITPGLPVKFQRPPVWSSDGRHIALIGQQKLPPRSTHVFSPPSAFVIGVDEFSLVSLGLTWSQPAWSPDGTRIAFVRRKRNDEAVLYTIAPDGSNPRQLLKLDLTEPMGAFFETISWSPDGSEILVLSSTTNHGQILVASVKEPSAESRNLQLWSDTDAAKWSPDGSRIAINAADRYYSGIVLYTIVPDGSDARALVSIDNGMLVTE